jgi:hypothetical protein
MLSVAEPFHPPYGYTGVERTSGVGLGWVAGSCMTDEGERDATAWASVIRGYLPGVVTKPRWPGRHYASGLAADNGSWAVLYDGRGGSAGTLMVQIRQGCFEVLDEARALGLAREVAGRIRLSRLDLWWDDRGESVRPLDLWRLMERGLVRPVGRLREITLHEDGHGVLRLGGRSSERYLRVYDKWDGAGRRVRHEIEIKGWAAAQAGELLGASARLGDLFDQGIGRMYRTTRVAG